MDYFSVYSTVSHWALSMARALSAALLAWFQPSKVHTLMRKMEENSDKESPCGGGGVIRTLNPDWWEAWGIKEASRKNKGLI